VSPRLERAIITLLVSLNGMVAAITIHYVL